MMLGRAMIVVRYVRCIPPLSVARPLSTSAVVGSGHNKWSKIKHKKGVNDLKKGQIYSKASRDILIAIRQGGSPDPEINSALAAVIKRVKSQGVPKDNIEVAIKKATGGAGSNAQAVTYEAMAGTVGVIIECLSDNANRTASKIKDILSKYGARTTPVAFMFQRQGVVRVAVEQGENFDQRVERVIEKALEAEAEDFEQEELSEGVVEIEFKCQPGSLAQLTSAVTEPGLCKELLGSELVYAPLEVAEPPDEETVTKISDLVETLEENEDTLRVWTSLDS